jgi:hypothetical protein
MSSITPSRRRRDSRPLWLTVVLVVVAMAVLFALGFGIATLLKGGDGSLPPEESLDQATASVQPLPCETVLITPAEVLPRTERVTVNVFNSTPTVGLAAETAQILTARGFTVRDVANDPLDAVLPGTGEIRFGPKGADAAQLLTFYFPGAVLVDDGRTGKRVDVSLGSGFTEIVGEAEIAAALASPSPSPSGPGCVAPSALPAPATDAPDAVTEPAPSP